MFLGLQLLRLFLAHVLITHLHHSTPFIMIRGLTPLNRSLHAIKAMPARIPRSRPVFSAPRFASSSATAAVKPASGLRDTSYVVAAFATVTLLFSSVASAVHLRLDSKAPIAAEVEAADPPSEFLFATGGKIKDASKPIWSRDDVTVVMVIGTPLAGKTEAVKRIAEHFDFQVEVGASNLVAPPAKR